MNVAGRTRKHLCLVIDDPVAPIVPDAAATQRVRGGRLAPQHRAGQRVLHVAAARLLHQRLQRRIHTTIDGLVLGTGPTQLETVSLQTKLARSTVVGDGKEGLQPRETGPCRRR